MIAVGGIYISLWLLTAFLGGPQVQRLVLGQMRLPQSSTDISAAAKFDSWPLESEVQMPYHWCVTRSYVPCLVVVHSGVMRAFLNGNGSGSLYLWLFGHTVKILDFRYWDS